MLGINGLVAATFTPLRDDGTLALDRVGPIAEALIRKGIAGLYVAGSTGEGVSLTSEERRAVTAEYIRAVDGRAPVIVQVGHNSVAEAAELARHADAAGAAAISAAPPSYFPINAISQLTACIEPIAGAAGVPFYYYHIPSRTHAEIDVVELLEAAGSIETFAGVKFTSPRIDEFQAAHAAAGDRFEILFGSDEMLLAALAVGAAGAVGTTYNFSAGLYQDIIKTFRAGDVEAAARLQGWSVELVRIIARHGGLSAMKALMAGIGLDCGPPRPPLRPLSKEDRRRMFADISAKGLADALDSTIRPDA